MSETTALDAEARGLRLCRIDKRENLILCEPVIFEGGRSAVDTILRRAKVSGLVEINGEIGDYFADVMSDPGTMVQTVALDRKSYGALKNHWMRCKVERYDR